MATYVPAQHLKQDHIGKLQPNCAADMLLFDCEFNLLATFIKGDKVYENISM